MTKMEKMRKIMSWMLAAIGSTYTITAHLKKVE